MPKITPTEWNTLNDQESVEAQLATPIVELTVAAEGGDAIVVTAQLQDFLANDLALVMGFLVWLSDTAGAVVTPTAPSGGTTVTDGLLIEEFTAERSFFVLSGVDGIFALTLSEAGVDTWYLNVCVPGGPIVSSAAITFA